MIKGIGQEGVLQYYKLKGNVYSTTREIAEVMNMNVGSVNRSLKALHKFNRTEFKVVTRQFKYVNCPVLNKEVKLWRLKQ